MNWMTAGMLCAATMWIAACQSGGETSGERAEINSAAFRDESPITADSATLIVHGMSCPLCANNADKKLRDVPGVGNVAIDMGSGKVSVVFSGKEHPSRAQLARAVKDAGFTLVRIDVE